LAFKAFLSHQARHALTPNVLAIGLEILVDARTPVGLATRSVRRSNLDKLLAARAFAPNCTTEHTTADIEVLFDNVAINE
jgi:hypothetical protein